MDFVTAVKTCLVNYAVFSGRAGRREYWWFMLFAALAGLAAELLVPGAPRRLLDAVLLPPILAAGCRRLHDTGESGWWQLVFAIPLLGWAAFLAMTSKPGQPWRNRFGAVPIG